MHHGDGSSSGRTPDCGSGDGEFEPPLSPEDYWLAGLLEGEGSFLCPSPSKPGYVKISIHMTDLDIVERVAYRWRVPVYSRPGQAAHHKSTYRTQLGGRRAIAEMRRLRPLMGERRRAQIDRALALAGVPRKLLTVAEREEITARLRVGEKAPALAAEFGVAREHIYKVAGGRAFA
jgi:hypothetical protein